MTTQLGVFAKYWEPGRVKTRLAASVGNDSASRLYRCFVATTLQRFQGAADHCRLAFSPPQRRAAFAMLAGTAWELHEQAGGDLGQRMSSYFDGAFSAGATKVVLIGTDSPTLPRGYVADAFATLAGGKQIVLGPSDDGGYYLVGMRTSPQDIFKEISWSTDKVWMQTITSIERARLDFGVLPPWYDVDEIGDLRRLSDELRTDSDSGLQQLKELVAAVLAS